MQPLVPRPGLSLIFWTNCANLFPICANLSLWLHLQRCQGAMFHNQKFKGMSLMIDDSGQLLPIVVICQWWWHPCQNMTNGKNVGYTVWTGHPCLPVTNLYLKAQIEVRRSFLVDTYCEPARNHQSCNGASRLGILNAICNPDVCLLHQRGTFSHTCKMQKRKQTPSEPTFSHQCYIWLLTHNVKRR